jgi:diacylglycerol kinase family enzyme
VQATLIVNPRASAVTPETLALVEAELGRAGSLTVVETQRRLHATELARAALGDTLFVYGGDGLLNEVVNGVDGAVPVGIVPGGGKNVVARALGLPTDPVEAARALTAAGSRRISLGRVNGRRFVFAAGVGFDAELIRRVDALGRRPDGRRPGDAAFLREALKLLVARRGRYEPALEIEGHGRAAFALVANGTPYQRIVLDTSNPNSANAPSTKPRAKMPKPRWRGFISTTGSGAGGVATIACSRSIMRRAT